MIKWQAGTETIFFRRPSGIKTPRKAQKGKGPWYMAIWHNICECRTTNSAHLQVGSQEERIVPGNLVPAQIISQDEDDVRPGLPRTTLAWNREKVITRSQYWPAEPPNINTINTRNGNMISLQDCTGLTSTKTGVFLNSLPALSVNWSNHNQFSLTSPPFMLRTDT